MSMTYTTIFCIIGKPGTGKTKFIKKIMSDQDFVERFGLTRMAYCTTKVRRYAEQEYYYTFMPYTEYRRIDRNDIIEFRSYDNYDGETYFSFTRKQDINLGSTYICECTPVQCINYIKWAKNAELYEPTNQIRIYPIIINSPIFNRMGRLWEKVVTDEDIYEFCGKILTEKYEFSLFIKDFPELLTDTSNRHSIVINNEVDGEDFIISCAGTIKSFIAEKMKELAALKTEIEEKEMGSV